MCLGFVAKVSYYKGGTCLYGVGGGLVGGRGGAKTRLIHCMLFIEIGVFALIKWSFKN